MLCLAECVFQVLDAGATGADDARPAVQQFSQVHLSQGATRHPSEHIHHSTLGQAGSRLLHRPCAGGQYDDVIKSALSRQPLDLGEVSLLPHLLPGQTDELCAPLLSIGAEATGQRLYPAGAKVGGQDNVQPIRHLQRPLHLHLPHGPTGTQEPGPTSRPQLSAGVGPVPLCDVRSPTTHNLDVIIVDAPHIQRHRRTAPVRAHFRQLG